MVESTCMSSWAYSADSDTHFPLENIPFGVAHCPEHKHKICVTRIGDHLVNLGKMEMAGKFDGPLFSALGEHKMFHGHQELNIFARHGKALRLEVRARLQHLFSNANKSEAEALKEFCLPVEGVKMAMPVFIRDYTDFYSSYNHAYNVGCMVRGPDNAI